MFNNFKKIIIITIIVCVNNLLLVQPTYADAVDVPFLTNIQSYTHDTLAAVNNLPEYIEEMVAFAKSWLEFDKSDLTANLQGDISNLTNSLAVTNPQLQLDLLTKLQTDYFGGEGVTPDMLVGMAPYLNDLTFSTLLNKPFFATDPRKEKEPNVDPIFNYVKNASGINIKHPMPSDAWPGTPESKQKYMGFYTAISAAQTYNGYLMSQVSSGLKLNSLQQKLMQDASNSDMFAEIAGNEKLGTVFRQLLLFNSQIYVLLVQMLQVQQQQLGAQVVANTLSILNNQNNETILVKGAKGLLPGT